ncbi:hypothetical protein BC936DRAFT_146011 [Jimgerdemannia flammicorona]|uniref:Uncharacterized protein n=1 Tax=Jimgerdemannia flammicorona TaxID=994334 RepID=A0A433DLS5_9FUNG|nr:hypothetical protein BC936DRAFT_146011 [Jimgerdemannia flammicorona]
MVIGQDYWIKVWAAIYKTEVVSLLWMGGNRVNVEVDVNYYLIVYFLINEFSSIAGLYNSGVKTRDS